MKKYPILILHGWKLSGKTFKPLVFAFKQKGYRVFAPDMPGFGNRKNIAKPFHLNDYVSFVKKFLKDKKINDVIIIGHSFGGRVAIKFTSIYPEKVVRLVLTGVPGFAPASRSKITFFLLISKIGKMILSLPILSSFGTIARKIVYRLARSTDYMNTQGSIRETFKNIIHEELHIYMKKLITPTLLVWGEDDNIIPVQIAQKMQDEIEKSKLIIIPNATHRVPYEKPEKFASVVTQFIYV